LDEAAVSTVNLSEVAAKLVDEGFSPSDVRSDLTSLLLEVVPFEGEQAFRAGFLRDQTRARGLSLGARACLALAEERGVGAMTTDRGWAALGLRAPEVVLIR
jgi:PIN domain nuclease of toxin-antitoxin system